MEMASFWSEGLDRQERPEGGEPRAREPQACADSVFATTAERVTMAHTLLEVSRLVGDCLALVAPDLHARTLRVTALVTTMAGLLELEHPWEFEVAARLSQVGCLAVPPADRRAIARGDIVEEERDRAFASHPLVSRDLLRGVRSLAAVREMIARQHEPYSVAGWETRVTPSDRVTIGAQLLRIAVDATALAASVGGPGAVAAAMATRDGEYHPRLLGVLEPALVAVTARGGAEGVQADPPRSGARARVRPSRPAWSGSTRSSR
jgi:response regulator RpfG family c-di-GMP phosphodiesterase